MMSLKEAIGYVAFDELIELNICTLVSRIKQAYANDNFVTHAGSFSFGLMKPASNGGKNSLVTKLAGTFIYLAPKYIGLHCTLYSSMNQVDEDIKSSSCGGGYGDDEGSRSNMARIANFN
ncbi:hypothetical protein FXO38_33527 [Capsicum annuum]|nr:hypothetical protein FXO38_33527 [Capsicum annuum]